MEEIGGVFRDERQEDADPPYESEAMLLSIACAQVLGFPPRPNQAFNSSSSVCLLIAIDLLTSDSCKQIELRPRSLLAFAYRQLIPDGQKQQIEAVGSRQPEDLANCLGFLAASSWL